MRQNNDLFPWLATMIISQFNVQIMQIWTVQADDQGQTVTELQGMSCQDTTFPHSFLRNPQIAAVADRAAQEHSSISIRPVEMIFPQPVAMFLKRHLLSYCISFFLGNVLLASAKRSISSEELSTPVAIVILLLLKQPPAQDLVPAIRFALQKAFSDAANRGLLQLAPANSLALPPRAHSQPLPLSFFPLIPHRVEDATSSPLAVSGAGLDAPTRRFYAAINGQRDVGELSAMARCSIEQAQSALQTLMARHLIKLYEPGGQLIDGSQLFKKQ